MISDALASLLDVVERAIQSGDWKVDGACDPATVIKQAESCLISKGYYRNSIDGSWQRDL
jgi:hypothetical protein